MAPLKVYPQFLSSYKFTTLNTQHFRNRFRCRYIATKFEKYEQYHNMIAFQNYLCTLHQKIELQTYLAKKFI